MYAIDLQGFKDATPSLSAPRKTRRGKPRAGPADFDFEACETIGAAPLRAALMTRSQPALNYMADVVDDLDENAEVCAHVTNSLSRSPDQIPCLFEMKRRCLITNLYTHSFYLKATFLPSSVRVRVKGATEQAAKQAAHVALVKCLCEKVLAQ